MGILTKTLLGVILAFSLTACGSAPTASRFATPDDTMVGQAPPDVWVESFTVSVPRSLKVNERNLYYPRGDIVWRGEPRGDRHAQVKAIFEAGLRRATPRVSGATAVRMDVQVLRFHALSEKARYTVGGVHDIDFRYRLVDIATGQQIGPTKEVNADLDALAGQAAMAAEGRGDTQKARITAHLERVFVEELTRPGGHVTAKLGLLQQINDL
ncbi:DUF6778 family protein [Marivita geojedonensis]|uniref:Lipoprotein n=1 Tax=Marivita geojedonensis TaxID=1123756 RepID=A0A1X4NKJ4_9RHOB|nr:DUF6778 family protein [Marivita geojedonensis]OSQ50733.1 hypothetical protein MGEO_10950 [Marivita geojedonensis]PRY77107.1 hypothetical protein CLV76_10995 [Marivita geojedonensis]